MLPCLKRYKIWIQTKECDPVYAYVMKRKSEFKQHATKFKLLKLGLVNFLPGAIFQNLSLKHL